MLKKMDHVKYPRSLRKKTDEELKFILKDANEAACANPDGPNVGYYLDEVAYCIMEQKRRKDLVKVAYSCETCGADCDEPSVICGNCSFGND